MSDPAADPRRAREWTRADVFALISVTTLAAALRLRDLGRPPDLMFDETYYAKDACWYVNAALAPCRIESPQLEVHPPLGKWLIAIGIRIFGMDSFGWRIAAAIAGIVTVALVYLLARRLLRSTLGATIASGLLAIDFLHFVQSRVSMLDVFVPLFGIAAILFVVYDHDQRRAIAEHDGDRTSVLDRPWRVAAGAAAGAAVASKWPGLFLLVFVILLAVAWGVAERRNDGDAHPLRAVLRTETPSLFVSFVALPLVLYLLTYVGRVDGTLFAAPWSERSWFHAVWDQQVYMFETLRDLSAHHGYESPAWSWLLLKRPVSYYFETQRDGDYMEIFASGSPFVWWASLLALLFVAIRWQRRRGAPEGIIFGGFAAAYFPWLLPLSDRPATFIFYLLPAIPFMCLAIAYVATNIGWSWEARAAIAVFALGAIAVFAHYYPLLTGRPLPQPEWKQRIWVFDDCDKPTVEPPPQTATPTRTGTGATATTTAAEDESRPPEGWCWI